MRLLGHCLLVFVALPIAAQHRFAPPSGTGPTNFRAQTSWVVPVSDGFLTAWVVDTPAGSRIDARRLDADGRAMTATAYTIVERARLSKLVRLGSRTLLVYWDDRFFTRFLFLDGEGRADEEVWPGSGVERNTPIVHAAGDGSRLLAITYGNGLTATLFDEHLRVVRAGIPVANDTQDLASIVPLETSFAVIRRDRTSGHLTLHRLGADGLIATPVELGTKTSSGRIVAASHGRETTVLWQFDEFSTDLEGVVIEDDAVVRRFTAAPERDWFRPEGLVSTPAGVILLASAPADGVQFVEGLRLDGRGDSVLSPVFRFPAIRVLDVALHGDTFVATAWAWRSDNVSRSFKMSEAFRSVAEETLAVLSARQTAPEIATDGAVTLVAWQETMNAAHALYVAIAGPDGERKTSPRLLSSDVVSGVRVAAGGGVFLVIWRVGGPGSSRVPVVGVRISPRGELLDPEPFVIGHRGWGQQNTWEAPALAWNGDAFVVAWGGVVGDYEPAFLTTTISPSGVIGDPYRVPGLRGDETETRLAWNGRVMLLAYTRFSRSPSFPVSWTDVEVITLDRSGRRIGESVFRIDRAMAPSLATDGVRFALTVERRNVMEQSENQPPSPVLFYFFDESGGVVSGPISIATTEAALVGTSMSDVSWNGSAFEILGWKRDGSNWRLWRTTVGAGTIVAVDTATGGAPDHWFAGRTIASSGGPSLIVTAEMRAETSGATELLVRDADDFTAWTSRRRSVHR